MVEHDCAMNDEKMTVVDFVSRKIKNITCTKGQSHQNVPHRESQWRIDITNEILFPSWNHNTYIFSTNFLYPFNFYPFCSPTNHGTIYFFHSIFHLRKAEFYKVSLIQIHSFPQLRNSSIPNSLVPAELVMINT